MPLCLLALVAVWLLWPRGEKPAASQNPSAAPAPVAATPSAAPATSAPDTTVAEDNGHPSEAVTNRLAFRLSNTEKSIGELTRDEHAVLLENAFIDTKSALKLKIPEHLQAGEEPGAFIVQARGTVDASLRAAIGGAGGQVISYIPNNALLVQVSSAGAAVLRDNARVQAVLPYEPYYKISSTLLGRAVADRPLAMGTFLTLGLYDRSAEATLEQLQKLGAKVVSQERSPFGQMVRVLPPKNWTAIAKLPGVQLVEPTYRRTVANDLARPAVGVAANTTTATNYLNLTGSNVIVAVNDTGIDMNHPDLVNRVFFGFADSGVDVDGHGTHVAGIIAGDGTKSLTVTNARGSINPGTNFQYRGKAPLARLYSVGFNGANDTNVPISESYLQQAGVLTNALISNNSWTYAGDNQYDLHAASYDAAMRDALPELTGPQPALFVFAAGNGGGGNDAGSGGAADTITSPATAKNPISVGALEELRNITNKVVDINGDTNAIWAGMTDSGFQVAAYSARGNVGLATEGAFGRFKPDVVAPGTFTISTRSTVWDEAAYYNITNYHTTTAYSDTITTNTAAYGSISIPQNAVGVQIRIVPRSFPFPATLPMFVSSSGIPDPTNVASYDFRKDALNVSIPPDSGGAISGIDVLKNGGISYAIGPMTNGSATFDVQEIVITTNDLGNQLEVLSNLNNTISGAGAPQHFYRFETGTSMAAPAVTGVLADMMDFFTNRLQLTPSPALLKAMLINGARVNGSYKFAVTNAINYQGWGLVKLSNSIPLSLTNFANPAANKSIFFVDQSLTNSLATGDTRTWNVQIPTALARAQALRVTLAWTDPPGNPAAAVKLVNDLDLIITNLDTKQVYYGNNFSQSGTPPFSLPSSTNSTAGDNINNVENIFLSSTLSTNYTITVSARAVNVNAVTLEETNIVQDFALVLTTGDGNNTNGFVITAPVAPLPTASTILPHVDYLPSTNGIYFNQIAGANAPWLQTNDVLIGAGSSGGAFYTNSVYHVGSVNQWHFYVVTNTFAVANSAFKYAAFITFLPNTQATPREGVFADTTANSTRPEGDLELLVASAPDSLASQITNLNMAVVSNCLFNVNGDGSSITRGGSEFVTYSNSVANQIYYIAVHCQDEMAGQYAFVPIFSDTPFSSRDAQGNIYVTGVQLPKLIPDGNNVQPGVAYVFALCLESDTINRVIVTNTFEHENFGDLYGGVTHGSSTVFLNNHDGLGTVTSTQEFIYDDSDRGDIIGVRHSDGPGTLKNFQGKQAVGVWFLNELDNSFTQTGAVTGFKLKIEPHKDYRKQPVVVSVPPGGWFYDYVDVPAGYTNLLAVATNLPPTSSPAIELYVKEGDQPTRADTDHMAFLVNGVPPGGSVSVGPPLTPDRYYIGLYNPDTISHDVLLGVTLTFDPGAVILKNFNQFGVQPLKDDAVTYASVFVDDTNKVQDVSIGLRVDHERISDLVFHLISPDGLRYLLMENRGGQTTNGCGKTIITTNIINVTAGGGSAAETNLINVGFTHGTFPITYNFYTAPDQMTVYYGTNIDPAHLIYDTGMTNNTPLGPGAQNTQPVTINVSFPPSGISADSTYLTVIMNQYGPTPRRTAWTYTAGGVITNYLYLSFTENTNLTTTPIKFAPTPFVPVGFTNYIYTTNLVYATNYLFSTNIAYVTNIFYATNFTYATNFVYSTNVLFTTNVTATTNISYTTNTTSVSTFDAASAGEYSAISSLDGWSVSSNQVSAVNDSGNANSGSQFLALASGSMARPLSATVGITNVLSFAYRGPGISGWWRGSSNVVDSVYGNNGALINTATYTNGLVGTAFRTFGVGYVQVPDNDLWAFGSSDFTVELWANFTASPSGSVGNPTGGLLIGNDDNSGSFNKWFFSVGGSRLNFHINGPTINGGAGYFLARTPFTPALNTWYHLAVERKNNIYTVYTNGVAGVSELNTSVIPNAAAPLTIGQCEGFYFNGKLDEVSIYGRALSPSEIKAIYQLNTVGKAATNVAAPLNLAASQFTLAGYATNVIYGNNTNWQTNAIAFVPTSALAPLKVDGLQPGMLLDSFTLTKYLPATNTVLVTNTFSATNIVTATNVVTTTNIVATTTNITSSTNVIIAFANGVTNFISTFDSAAAGDYLTLSSVDGWSVSNNQVSVVNDALNSQSGSKFLALANGSISVNLPTTAGVPSVLSFSYRGPGILGWWRGQANANDEINGNAGTLINGATFGIGEVGLGYDLNGSDYVDLGNPATFNPTNALTIDYWVNVRGQVTPGTWSQNVMGKDGELWNGQRQYKLIVGDSPTSAGNPDFRAHVWLPSGPAIIDSTNVVQTNTWYHVAQTYDGTSLKLYVNGVLDGQLAASGPIVTTPEPLRFGQGPPGSGYEYPFNGILDEPSIYNRALSASEIHAIYQAGGTGKYDHAAAAPQNLAKARFTLAGQGATTYYGDNNNWTTVTIPFTPTANATALQIEGLEPGMLIDSIQLTTAAPIATNYNVSSFASISNLYYLPEQDISGIIGSSAYGQWTLEILDNRKGATNNANLLSWQMEVTYADTNFAPAPTFPNLSTNFYSVIESNLFVLTNTATSFRTNAVLIYALSGPTNATINTNTGVITWFPLESQAPDTNVFVTTVYDAAFPTKIGQNYFQVVALESNLPPIMLWPTNNEVVRILEPDSPTFFVTNLLGFDSDLPTNNLAFALHHIVNVSGQSATNLAITVDGTLFWPMDETTGPSTNIIFVTLTDTNPYTIINPQSFTITNQFTLVVGESNRPPVLTLPPNTNIVELIPWSAQATATDPDVPTNTLTFALVGVVPALSNSLLTVSSSGVINWTPNELQGPGDYTIFVKVSDFNPWAVNQQVLSVTNSFAIHVDEWNIAPVLATNLPDTNIMEMQTLTVNNPASDPDAPFNSLTYSLSVSPVVTNAFITTNGTITWTPTEAQGPGDYTFTTTVTDTNPPAINQTSFTVQNSFIVHVGETNSAPFWTNNYPDVVLDELTFTNVFATAIDTDLPPNTITYTLGTNAVTTNLPTWVYVDPFTGVVTLAPLSELNGPSTNIITVIATDNGAPPLSAATSFRVVVNEVNRPPTLPFVNDQLVYAGEEVVVDDSAIDPDIPLNSFTYELLTGPVGLVLNTNTGLVTWQTATNTPQGTNLVIVKVTDYNPWAIINQSYSATNAFNIIVLPPFTNDVTTGIPAFPGAEGAGGYAIGGRGGDVYHVTNLNDDGPGSLRYGTRASHRTIVFDVSGTISLASDLRINRSYLTIAGQTAPGDGITLMGRLTSVGSTHDVEIRFLRFRAGDTNCPDFQDDSFHFRETTMSIVDHVSASWSIDEVLSTTYGTNITVQWSMIADALNDSCHEKGKHGYGSLIRYGDGAISYHHNLYANNYSRNPRLGDNITLDFVNNVVANWGILPGYSADDTADNPGGFTNKLNYAGNYLIAGSNTVLVSTAFDGGSPTTTIFQSGNFIDSNLNGNLDGANTGWGMFSGLFTQTGSAFAMPAPAVTQHSAPEAYERVLAFVGATATKRDLVDSNIVRNVRAQTGHIINSQYEVGGWPTLASTPTPLDTDQDGMPDWWEILIGLNKSIASDGILTNTTGYTRLEEYLNWLANPHAFTTTNTPVDVDLKVVAGSTGNLTFSVVNGTNGTVVLLPDGHTARFTPAADIGGFGSFAFNVNDTTTGIGFGPVSVSVVIVGGLVIPNIPPATNGFMLVQYNVKGNGALDWSTNAAQVQAIGRELRYLNPDIITFNEIPVTGVSEMVNWAKDFLAGYTVMVSPNNDGFIGTAIATRFPVIATNSWLAHSDLSPYGYAGNFTRDLFEAQIIVPGYSQPLHVLTTHLKSSASGYADAALKRAAEAAAITNFIATNLMVLYPNDLVTLSGDMNEANTNTTAIQSFVNSGAGLRLTNPTNQLTGSINTFSSATPSSRIDYVMPCVALASNVINAQVFRTSVLNPVPSGLNASDDQTASDHLPVFAVFGSPYGDASDVTNDVPTTNTIPAGGIRYYRVHVPLNADLATNALLFATGPLDVWFTTNTPPSIARVNDSLLITNSTSGQRVLDTVTPPAIIPGKVYYLGVHNSNTYAVTNAILVTFHFIDPTSFSISSIVQTNSNGTNGWLLTWFAPTNTQFHLQWTTNLAPQVWKELKGVISVLNPTNGLFQYFDDGDTNRNSAPFGPMRFYRLHFVNSPSNTPPEFIIKLTAATNFVVGINTNFALTNLARDWDIPAQNLSYSVLTSIATTNPVTVTTNGLVQWTPVTAESGSTNIITTIVRDDGVPQKSVTNSFTIFVVGGPPVFSSIYFNTNGVNFVWYGTTNQQFDIQTNTDLATTNWGYLAGPITSTNGTFYFVDPNTNAPLMFYRLLLLP